MDEWYVLQKSTSETSWRDEYKNFDLEKVRDIKKDAENFYYNRNIQFRIIKRTEEFVE